ncbi:lytic transglycosylase domain-containing protein [Cesiribacter sp. SM1]|uniref:lytic transglycosylase domain-containing protein n=1 Tax=Cesiribacter sp. SM1 TaxID=2861196 RepID=UPI001CD53DE1|nr:lytic transglycosylase domain-containing protein [Cesiribacter sp. SM1]
MIQLIRIIRLLLLSVIFFTACNSEKTADEGQQQNFVDKSAEVRVVVGDSAHLSAPQFITTPPLPQSVSFAGEAVPLHKSDVREALENELTVNMFRHSRTMVALKNIERWRPLVEQTLRENGVPADFIYLGVAESELDNNAESYVGATGMWQFMEATAKDFNLPINRDADMRRDPKLSTEAACRYFKWAYEQFGDWTLVAASYNRGVSGIQKALKDQQADSFYDLHLNQETARYVYRILAFKLILENPEAYGYFLKPEERYQPYEYNVVTVDEDIDDLVSFAKSHNTTYKELRLLNPWFNNTSSYKLNVPRKTTYEIRIPAASPGNLQ